MKIAHMLATALAMLGAIWSTNASAAIQLDSGVLQTSKGEISPLSLGLNRLDTQGYDILCHAEFCDGLRFGGATYDYSWRFTVTPETTLFLFRGFQGSDLGYVADDYYFEAIFSAPREIIARSNHVVTASTENCGNCTRSFNAHVSTWEDAGRWYAGMSGYGQGAVSVGEQSLVQFFSVKLVEVPEPGTWAMMIFGFAAIGGAMRHKRVNSTALQIG